MVKTHGWDPSQLDNSDDNASSHVQRAKPRWLRIRLVPAVWTMVGSLYFGKRAVSAANAAEIVRSPQPCWLGQPVPGASEVPEAAVSGPGLTQYDAGVDANPAEPGVALEARLIRPRGAVGTRHHRIRRRRAYPPVTTSNIAGLLNPGSLGQPVPGAGEVPEAAVSGPGLTQYDAGVDANPAEPGVALEARLIRPPGCRRHPTSPDTEPPAGVGPPGPATPPEPPPSGSARTSKHTPPARASSWTSPD